MRNRLSKLAISDEGFLFDPETGNSYTTNRAGLFILGLLKEGARDGDVVRKLVERFGLSEGEAENDFRDFKELLVSERLFGEDDE